MDIICCKCNEIMEKYFDKHFPDNIRISYYLCNKCQHKIMVKENDVI